MRTTPPPPLIPSVAHNPSELEHLVATHAPSSLSSEEEFALLVRYSNRNGRIQFVHAFLYATYMIDSCSQIFVDPLLSTSHLT